MARELETSWRPKVLTELITNEHLMFPPKVDLSHNLMPRRSHCAVRPSPRPPHRRRRPPASPVPVVKAPGEMASRRRGYTTFTKPVSESAVTPRLRGRTARDMAMCTWPTREREGGREGGRELDTSFSPPGRTPSRSILTRPRVATWGTGEEGEHLGEGDVATTTTSGGRGEARNNIL